MTVAAQPVIRRRKPRGPLGRILGTWFVRSQSVGRILFILPLLTLLLFQPYGLVNTAVVQPLGFEPINWLTSTGAVIPAFIISTSWRIVPLCIVIFLAGLQTIPEELYEAAKVDGASMLHQFR